MRGEGNRVFFDTNVIVYAHDNSSPEKRDKARKLLAQALTDGSGVLSAQVLGETFISLTKKFGVEEDSAADEILQLSAYRIVEVSSDLVLRALEIKANFQMSYWDALIVAAAEHAGCGTLFSEDLNDGQCYGTVTVNNPFS